MLNPDSHIFFYFIKSEMQFAFGVPLSWSRPVSAAKEGKGHRRKSRQVRPIAAVDCQKPSALHSQMFLACRDSSQFVSTTVQRAGFGKISFVFKAKAQIFILTNSEGSQVTLMYPIGFKYWSFPPQKKKIFFWKSPFYNGAVFVALRWKIPHGTSVRKLPFPSTHQIKSQRLTPAILTWQETEKFAQCSMLNGQTPPDCDGEAAEGRGRGGVARGRGSEWAVRFGSGELISGAKAFPRLLGDDGILAVTDTRQTAEDEVGK